GAANDLNPLDIGQRYAVQVRTGQGGLVQTATVHQYQGIVHGVLTEATQAQRGTVAVTHGVANLQTCLATQQIQQIGGGAALDLLSINHRYACWCWRLEVGCTGNNGGRQLGRSDQVGLVSQRQAGGQRYRQGNTGQFHEYPQKVGKTFEEGRQASATGRVVRYGRRHLTVMPSATPVTLHAGRPPDSWRSSAHLPMLRHSGSEQTPIVIGASYRCGGSAGIVRRTHRLSVSRLNQAHLHE